MGTENSALKNVPVWRINSLPGGHRKLRRNHRISIAMGSYGWARAVAQPGQ